MIEKFHISIDSRMYPEVEFLCKEEDFVCDVIGPEAPSIPVDCCAYILSYPYFCEYASYFRRYAKNFPSIILINKNRSEIPEELEPEIYAEFDDTREKERIIRAVRNLSSRIMLECRFEREKDALSTKEKVNRELLNIGIALSAERDSQKLLELILTKSREITHADAGSLYLVVKKEGSEEQELLFKISQNDTNPADYTEFHMPLNTQSIAGYVASTGKALNIPDAYTIPKKLGITFNRNYDKSSGYRTKSMLTLPMKDHKDVILGVIQLINKKRDFSVPLKTPEMVDEYVEAFDAEDESIVLSLASQAAVSLENNQLYEEIEILFEGFVKASVKAIESRDPTTSGHSSRVAIYTVSLAEAVSEIRTGPYKDVSFSREQIKEIRYASLLHDFGKVGVREHVLVKAKKLYPEHIELLKQRFAYIKEQIRYDYMVKRFNLLKEKGESEARRYLEELDREEAKLLSDVDANLDVVLESNEPKLLAEEPARLLAEIASHRYIDIDGREAPYLTEQEINYLQIRKGSLSDTERNEIQSHVIHTYEFLKNIPWTTQMKNIPTIARSHHEMLNGDGYPLGLKGEDIPLQSRMMAVADIYDALTAQDRPYKPALPAERALDILKDEAKSFHLDSELVRVFIDAKIYQKGKTQ